MARTLITILIAGLALSGCGTLEKRLAEAAKVTGEARVSPSLPALPAACVVKVERVYPIVGEKARWTQKRWEYSADNRDQQAVDCQKTWDAARKSPTGAK